MYPFANFIKNPFSIEDLKKPCHISKLKQFVIQKEIELPDIDYQNLITDLCVQRNFIETNKKLCYIKNDIWHCLFAHQKNDTHGTLIMSENFDYPRWAAII